MVKMGVLGRGPLNSQIRQTARLVRSGGGSEKGIGVVDFANGAAVGSLTAKCLWAGSDKDRLGGTRRALECLR
ncbi:hypothetical protein CCP4SC76_5010011 [Gammaproteobacteria bacterium]